jgi:glyoxylase-like metal-dependent hydrolase (beta-lactamase superfamily II)
MQIANGIKMLELSKNHMGKPLIVYPTLLDDPVILVDTGYPGQLPQIREAMEKAGVPFGKLKKVILTHHDADHMGNTLGLQNELQIEVLAHEEEKPYLEGTKQSIRLAQIEALRNIMPEETKTLHDNLKAFFENNKIKVSKTVIDGEELPYCGGITVIYTPGHTLGHICLYHRQSKTLIAGDALVVAGGKLYKALEFTNFDADLYEKTLPKLTEYDIEAVICYHGGLYKENVNKRIAELVGNRNKKPSPESLSKKLLERLESVIEQTLKNRI